MLCKNYITIISLQHIPAIVYEIYYYVLNAKHKINLINNNKLTKYYITCNVNDGEMKMSLLKTVSSKLNFQ